MAAASAARSLTEVRLLDGPNLYFPRPAAKVTLDLTELLGLPEAAAGDLGAELDLGKARAGSASTVFRQRFAIRIVTQVVRRLGRQRKEILQQQVRGRKPGHPLLQRRQGLGREVGHMDLRKTQFVQIFRLIGPAGPGNHDAPGISRAHLVEIIAQRGRYGAGIPAGAAGLIAAAPIGCG